MKIVQTAIPDVLMIEPKAFVDERGFFFESFNQAAFELAVCKSVTFVQDNHSSSLKNVLRGLHYQIHQPQGKLLRVVQGEVFYVSIDIRKSSPTFGQWIGQIIFADNKKQLWLPEVFAQGFVLSDSAEFLYKKTDYYLPELERSIAFNDSTLAVKLPIEGVPTFSIKDQQAKLLASPECFA